MKTSDFAVLPADPSERVLSPPRLGIHLIELLCVIAIMPSSPACSCRSGQGKAKAEKTLCASNGRQWGLAINLYSLDCDNSFPITVRAGLSWMMPSMSNFWNNYLFKNNERRRRPSGEERRALLPTDVWHRAAEAGMISRIRASNW